jgi:signal transduction histidine kinase
MTSIKGDRLGSGIKAQAETLFARSAKTSSPLHRRCAAITAVVALLALAGHFLDAPLLSRFVPERPALSPMTAIAMMVAASALAFVRSTQSRALSLALIQFFLGMAIVVAHAAYVPERGWLPPTWWSSPLTGAGIAISGAGTALLVTGRVLTGQLLAFSMLLLSVLFGLGHVFPRADLYRYLPGTGVAIPTVLSFVTLSLGQLLSFSDRGASAALSPQNTAGRAGLRLLAVGALAALSITAAVLASFRSGVFDAETAVLLVSWSALALIGASLWGLAAAVRRAELSREAAQGERNQLRHLVTAALTHDLRSPLQAASMSAVILQRLVATPEAAAAVGRLQRSHRRLERLLRSLLDNLALDSGQELRFQAASVALEALVRDVVEENETALRGRVDLQGEATGWWDPDALFRVIENLLLNAVKYGEPGTPLTVRITPGVDHAVLTTTNQGRAIPAEEWESIFLPFSRSQSARDGHQLGWGVGLTYARAVIQGHGGRVRVASSNADGTTFEVRLPTDARRFMARSLQS